jgi:acyl carrier protein
MDTGQEIRNYIVDNMLFGDGKRLHDDISFQESGILDSIGFLELITFVEKRFGIEIADRELIPDDFDTLRKISRFVQNKIQSKGIAYNTEAVK